jgi:SAM-dependent methyltransferase
MRWFLGLNHDAPHFSAYAQMVQAAVLSAPPGSGLEPHLLFDGPECELTRWFRACAGEVIFRQTFLKPNLAAAAADPGTASALSHGSGVYLRTEIPDLLRERDWDDATVLYTDSDILFTPRFRAADLPVPTHPIAVAPDFEREGAVFNSGFMLFHLPLWWPLHERFKEFLLADLPNAIRHEWDQFSFQQFFARNFHRLDPVWNWKPYWGENPEARVLHFHGPKPFLRDALRQGTAHPLQAQLATGLFAHACEEFDRLVALARRAGDPPIPRPSPPSPAGAPPPPCSDSPAAPAAGPHRTASRRNRFTHQDKIARWLSPDAIGAEVGAGASPVPGFNSPPFYIDCFKSFGREPNRADFFGHACALPFFDHTLDYVIASHVLEHVANPVAALAEFHRVVRPGGLLYLVVPDRRRTWEHRRRPTPIDHLLEDFLRQTTACDPTHIDEFVFEADWSLFSPDTPAAEVPARQAELARGMHEAVARGEDLNIHFHAFEPANFRALLEQLPWWPPCRLRWHIVDFAEDFPSATPNGLLAILRVHKGWRARAEAEAFRLRSHGNPRAALRPDAEPFAAWSARTPGLGGIRPPPLSTAPGSGSSSG